MSYSRAGILFLIAVTQFILSLTVAEALYPGYSISGNFISDLGVGPSSTIFNASVFLLGVLILYGTYLLWRTPKFKVMSILLVFMGVGAMGVGIFNKDIHVVHGSVSLVAFLFAGLSAMTSFRVLEKPLSTISMVLGVISLGALTFFSVGLISSGSLTSSETFDSGFFLGLGPGGMERLIVYPVLVWLASLGGYLASQKGI